MIDLIIYTEPVFTVVSEELQCVDEGRGQRDIRPLWRDVCIARTQDLSTRTQPTHTHTHTHNKYTHRLWTSREDRRDEIHRAGSSRSVSTNTHTNGTMRGPRLKVVWIWEVCTHLYIQVILSKLFLVIHVPPLYEASMERHFPELCPNSLNTDRRSPLWKR